MVRMRNMVHGQPTHLIENGTQWAHVYQKSNKVLGCHWNRNLWSFQTSRIIFGHDARRRFQEDTKYIGLDTGAVYGDRLTALIHFPNSTETILSVDSKAYSPVRGELIHTDSWSTSHPIAESLIQIWQNFFKGNCFNFLFASYFCIILNYLICQKSSSSLIFRDWKSKSYNHVEEFGKENSDYISSMRIL